MNAVLSIGYTRCNMRQTAVKVIQVSTRLLSLSSWMGDCFNRRNRINQEFVLLWPEELWQRTRYREPLSDIRNMWVRWDRVCLCGGVQIVICRNPASAVKAEAALFPKAPDIRKLSKAGLLPNFPARCLLKRFTLVHTAFGENVAFTIPFAADKRYKPTSIF